MQIDQAIKIIYDYQERYSIPDVLATLEEMHLCFEDLTFHEAQAYRIFMNEARELFRPRETA
jgi:hypothetical protein